MQVKIYVRQRGQNNSEYLWTVELDSIPPKGDCIVSPDGTGKMLEIEGALWVLDQKPSWVKLWCKDTGVLAIV